MHMARPPLNANLRVLGRGGLDGAHLLLAGCRLGRYHRRKGYYCGLSIAQGETQSKSNFITSIRIILLSSGYRKAH